MPSFDTTTAASQVSTEPTADLERRLILLIGTPRSGTTWLAALLNTYPGVVYSHEPLTRLHAHRLETLIDRVKASGQLLDQERHEVLHEWCTAYHDCRRPPFFRKRFMLAPPWLQLMSWVLVRMAGRGEALFRHLFSPSESSSFDLLIKDIDWSKHAQLIVRAFNPMLVNIIRHPCAVVASQIRGQRLGLMPGHNREAWLQEHGHLCKELGFSAQSVHQMTPYEYMGLEWLVQNLCYYSVCNTYARSHLVIYEELCRNPLAETQRVFDFLGWELGSQTRDFIAKSTQENNFWLLDWLQAKHPYFGVRRDSIQAAESWKSELTDVQKEQVLSVAGSFGLFKEYWSDWHSGGAVGHGRAGVGQRIQPESDVRLDDGQSSHAQWRLPLSLTSERECHSVQPVTVGIPFPRGMLHRAERLRLLDDKGEKKPLQSVPLNRWADGSISWLLLDSLVEHASKDTPRWTLELAENASATPCSPCLRVRESPGEICIDTGPANFVIRRDCFPFASVLVNGKELLAASQTRLLLTNRSGRRIALRVESLEVDDWGPVRATVRLEGAARALACRFKLILSFFAGTGLVRARVTLHNPRRSVHRGGLWDLGDRGSVHFREWTIELGLSTSDPLLIQWSAQPEGPRGELRGEDLEIYQDSSGGENWSSKNHLNRHGEVPCTFRGYRVRHGRELTNGLRASPVVSVRGVSGGLSVAIPEFWQQFPKAMEVRGQRVRVSLFPSQFGESFELQGGEQKTHDLWLDFHSNPGSQSLDWIDRPVRVHAAATWYQRAGTIPFIPPCLDSEGDRLETYLREIIHGPKNLLARREITDEYGWRNYGDLYADHELAYYRGSLPLISHYNNQYDVIHGAIVQYLRSGDRAWFDLLDPMARHVIDIDLYRTSKDRAAYNGGLFWHTDHYVDAATCTHRAFSRWNRPASGKAYGGGPSNEHNYTTGLLHYYFLTGDVSARDAVISLADWVFNRDDGRQSIFGVVERGSTGLASCTHGLAYHGPGRGCGNSVNALLDAWLATGRQRYLDKAEALIRRSIHPADDVDARDLLNVEERWSYTVFLWVLARYLWFKKEAGELDYMYAYARASLLVYATWMLEHERPYFDHPEKLEYPTETWAAQELRKANVLRLAAGYAGDTLAEKLRERGQALAERAWQDLLRFDSRYVTRAAAIVLLEGTRDAYLRHYPLEPQPLPPYQFDFGAPSEFIPQRLRVFREVRTVRGLARIALRLLSPRNWIWYLFPSRT